MAWFFIRKKIIKNKVHPERFISQWIIWRYGVNPVGKFAGYSVNGYGFLANIVEVFDEPQPPTLQTHKLIGYPLDQHLNLKHPLNQLAELIDWTVIKKTFSGHFVTNRGRPGLRPRLMVSVQYLQLTFDCFNELVVSIWLNLRTRIGILHGWELFWKPLHN